MNQCPYCKCTPDNPCRLEAGEDAIFMMDRGHCNNPKCIMAADLEKRRGRRSTEATRRKEVAPIRERWMETRRKDIEMRRKQRRKTKGRAA